jgi:3-oxoacyl-[acyl-carrier protein] reductase
MTFKDKNILVVGGSSGIGLSLVKQLAAEGANLINISRNASDEWPAGIRHITLDLTGDISMLASHLPEQLHGLVYAAGSINLKPISRLTADDFMNDFRLNVVSAAQVIQMALKPLRQAGNSSVVLFSTVATQTGMGFHASVAAAKGAVNGLTLSLAAELAPYHIRVNAVAPSLTNTPLAANLLSTDEKREASNKRHPLGRYGQPEDIANITRFLLSEESSWITGQIISVDGGMSTLKML